MEFYYTNTSIHLLHEYYNNYNIHTAQIHAAHSVPPQFISQPQNVTVTESTTALFECSAIGNPTPTITWKRIRTGGNESLQGQRPGGDLYITSVKRNFDEGTYYCTASNSAGTIVSNGATLKIMGKSINLIMQIRESRFRMSCVYIQSSYYYIIQNYSCLSFRVRKGKSAETIRLRDTRCSISGY